MWRPTIEFVFGLTIGFTYAYISTYLLSDYTVSRRTLRCKCPESFGGIREDVPIRTNQSNTYMDKEPTNRLLDVRNDSSATNTKQLDLSTESNAILSQMNDIRLLCWVMTSPQNLEKRAKFVQMTWAQKCDKHIFVSSQTNITFPTVGVDTSEGREHLTEKTMLGFEYVYKYHYNDADWFLKADDDAYVIVENLKYFLSNQNSEQPIYFGHHFKPYIKQGYFSGGSGFVVSKEALRRFGESGTESNLCRNQHGVAGDAKFGLCMQNLGVKTGNSTDKYGRNRFHCFDMETHLRGYYPRWYNDYDANGAKFGTDSMSTYPISFHYMEKQYLSMHHLLYHVRPFRLEADKLEHINQT